MLGGRSCIVCQRGRAPTPIPADAAAGLLLHAQGLLDRPDRRPTRSALLRTVWRMGYVQIDSINVVARAHDLILRARFKDYRPEHLARLLEWTGACSRTGSTTPRSCRSNSHPSGSTASVST